MPKKIKRGMCYECRKETEYVLRKEDYVHSVRGKEYTFSFTVAICTECGEEMCPHGLIDKNIKEFDE